MQKFATFYVKYKKKKYPVRQIDCDDKKYLIATNTLRDKLRYDEESRRIIDSIDYYIPDTLIDADDKTIWEYVNKILKLQYYEDADFISINNGMIHWWGYFYNSDGWHILEYSGFETSVKDFVKKYHNNPSEAYEEMGAECKQYLFTEDDLDPEEDVIEHFSAELEAWLRGEVCKVIEIDPKDISKKTPDGEYVLLWNK